MLFRFLCKFPFSDEFSPCSDFDDIDAHFRQQEEEELQQLALNTKATSSQGSIDAPPVLELGDNGSSVPTPVLLSRQPTPKRNSITSRSGGSKRRASQTSEADEGQDDDYDPAQERSKQKGEHPMMNECAMGWWTINHV